MDVLERLCHNLQATLSIGLELFLRDRVGRIVCIVSQQGQLAAFRLFYPLTTRLVYSLPSSNQLQGRRWRLAHSFQYARKRQCQNRSRANACEHCPTNQHEIHFRRRELFLARAVRQFV